MLVNLNDVLKKAQNEHYAVGLFNTIDTDMLEAAIAAAEEMRSPIIIGTAEVLLPYGELKLIAPSIIKAAKRATVPVVVHYDHGLTFERCMEALRLGFSSIMFDGSAGDSDKNIADTKQIVRIAHSFGATVEGEIGHVGEAANGDNATSDRYTTVKEAEDFINNFIENIHTSTDLRNTVVVDKLIMMSCKAAIKANDRLSPDEVNALIADLSKCVNPFSCPHGRPTFIKLTRYEIEKMFKRV